MKYSKSTILTMLCIVGILSIGVASMSGFSTSDTSETTASDDSSDDPFSKVMQVLTHKRCVNCHPAGDAPRQGEDSHIHYFDVARGEDGHGLEGYTCNTCHQDENNHYSGVPGAPHWGLAPRSMAWKGKTRVEIARQMMDPKRNGGRSHKDILEHLTEDALVLWAWNPGVDAEGNAREIPPVPKEEYIVAVKEWIEGGAIIPAQ